MKSCASKFPTFFSISDYSKLDQVFNMLNHKKIPKNNCLIVVLFLIGCALISTGLPVGLSISHYAHAHSLPVTETPAANSIIPKGAALPSKLTIDFSERPSPTVSSIQVLKKEKLLKCSRLTRQNHYCI